MNVRIYWVTIAFCFIIGFLVRDMISSFEDWKAMLCIFLFFLVLINEKTGWLEDLIH